MKRKIFRIILIAFSLRFIYFISVATLNPEGFFQYDSYNYRQLAVNMIENGTFSISRQPPIYPESFRTPLYPLFLACMELFSNNVLVHIFIQLLISTFSCVLVYIITRDAFENEKAAIFSAGVIALDVPSIIHANIILTETLFVFLLLVAVYFFINYLKKNKSYHLILCGFFLSACTLCKPTTMYLPLIFIPIMLFPFRNNLLKWIKASAILCITVAVCFVPWLWRNYMTFNAFFFSTSSGVYLCSQQATAIYSQKYNIGFKDAQRMLKREMALKFPVKWPDEAVKYAGLIGKESIKIILSHPALFIKQQIKGVFELLLKPARGQIEVQLGFSNGSYNTLLGEKGRYETTVMQKFLRQTGSLVIFLVIVQILLLLIIYAAAVKGATILYRNKKYLLLLLFVLLIFYFANLTVPQANDSRFRVPVMPFVAVIGGIGLERIVNFIYGLRKNETR